MVFRRGRRTWGTFWFYCIYVEKFTTKPLYAFIIRFVCVCLGDDLFSPPQNHLTYTRLLGCSNRNTNRISNDNQSLKEHLLACVSDKCRQLATSKRFGRDKYLLCLNCFSSSSNCCDVKAVRGRRVLPSIACCICRPPEWWTKRNTQKRKRRVKIDYDWGNQNDATACLIRNVPILILTIYKCGFRALWFMLYLLNSEWDRQTL